MIEQSPLWVGDFDDRGPHHVRQLYFIYIQVAGPDRIHVKVGLDPATKRRITLASSRSPRRSYGPRRARKPSRRSMTFERATTSVALIVFAGYLPPIIFSPSVMPTRSARLAPPYIYDHTWSLTTGRVSVGGTTDATLYGTATGSPNSAGWIFELAYLPFSHGGPSLWPWLTSALDCNTPAGPNSTAPRQTLTGRDEMLMIIIPSLSTSGPCSDFRGFVPDSTASLRGPFLFLQVGCPSRTVERHTGEVVFQSTPAGRRTRGFLQL